MTPHPQPHGAPPSPRRHRAGPRARALLLLAVPLLAAGQAPPPDGPPEAPHPLWGTWKFTLADGICAETYHFRRDGTTVVTSGAEVSESVYTISALPSAKGYYKLFDRITRGNGKKDCTGAVTAPGREATTYIRFHPTGTMLIFCESESLDNCIGPLARIPDEEM
jgi:hypothetical protein